jgi:hypothetical protein
MGLQTALRDEITSDPTLESYSDLQDRHKVKLKQARNEEACRRLKQLELVPIQNTGTSYFSKDDSRSVTRLTEDPNPVKQAVGVYLSKFSREEAEEAVHNYDAVMSKLNPLIQFEWWRDPDPNTDCGKVVLDLKDTMERVHEEVVEALQAVREAKSDEELTAWLEPRIRDLEWQFYDPDRLRYKRPRKGATESQEEPAAEEPKKGTTDEKKGGHWEYHRCKRTWVDDGLGMAAD